LSLVDSKKKRIPGQLCILISFVPWILYWVLSGVVGEAGIVVALATSLLVTAPQLRGKEPNLMDVATTLYFVIAALGAYIFSASMFVERSGFLGYLALFVMAIFSIAVKKPFTFQASKRDYPEVYWRDRLFLSINNVVSGLWAVVFLASALMYLLLGELLSVALSSALIALGVALSVIYPLKAPARRAYSEFGKYDWRVDVDPKRPKETGEYDVIVVGAGIGGLTCSALLSKRGYKVLVLEQHYQVGGYCSSFKRKGFTFNTGVEDVSGLWERGPVTYLLNELGLKRDDLFVKNRRRIVFKGRAIDVPDDLDELVELLSEMFPGEKKRIAAFFDEALKAYEECYRDTHVYGVPLPAELIVKVQGEKKLLDYPKEHPHFYDWTNKTFRQKLDEYFENEDLKALLCAFTGYVGSRPEKVSAASALTASISYFLHGGYYPKGGAQRFAEALREAIEAHGGRVLLKHRVDRILVEGGKVVGVKCGNEIFRAPIVVANANAKKVFLELVGEEHLDKEFVEYIRGLKMSPSAFMVFLGVDMDLSAYPTIIVDLDEELHVVVNSNADPSLAPEGKASVTIMTLANYHDFPERGTEEYLEKKRARAEELIKKAEKVIPGLSKYVVVQDAATPKTFERYTSMPEGAIYSFDQSMETRRPYFKTPIRGLYLVGASTFPGGGVEGVVISGIICANDITGWNVSAPLRRV
jgi:all-trans-retinol 13,14-reductase